VTPQTSPHRSTKIAAALRLVGCAAVAVSLLAQSLQVSFPSAAITAGASETFTASVPANWSLSGQGTLSPTVNTTASVYTAPGAVTVNQVSTITATAGANSIPNTVMLLPPSPVVSPSSGTYNVGQPVTFTVAGSQGDNWTGNNGNEVLVLNISPTTNYQWNNTCNVQYRPSLQGGTVFLVTDSGNQPYPSGIIGASQVLGNSQCSVSLAGATQSWNGPNVTVHIPITFAATFTGPKTIFAQAYPDTNDMYFAVGGINLVVGSSPSISIAPATASLTAGQNQQFTATVNNLPNSAVNWTLNPPLGSISSAGLYTAPSPVTGPQNVTVIATSQVNSVVSGTAAITLSGSIATDLNIPATSLTSGATSYQATHNITANSGFTMSGTAGATFLAGNLIDIGPGFHATAGTTFRANIGSGAGLTQTITTAPITGLQLTVAGQPCTSPCTVIWTPGQTYNISLTSPQFQSADVQYVFNNWSDGGAQSHTVTAPSAPSTYTANLATQYALTTSVTPPGWGTVTPSGWYNAGASTSVTATPAMGYSFANFTGDVSGSPGANPTNVVMTGPMNVVANFTIGPDFGITIPNSDQTVQSTGQTAIYTVTLLPQPGFLGPVTLSVSANPPLPSQNLSFISGSLPVGASWSTGLQVSAPSGTPASWDLTITATNGPLVHVAVAHFTLGTEPDFRITVSPPATPIVAGQSGVYSVRVDPVNGFAESTNVNLSISNLPVGATAVPGTLTVLANGSYRSFTISTAANTPTSASFSITGTGGGKSRTIWPNLNMQSNPAGTYTISGQVQQPDGSGIGGTTFQVRNSQNAVVATAGTDDLGNYSISLASGQYTVTASSPFGKFSPAAESYDLSTEGASARHRRLKTFLLAPPEEEPYYPAQTYYPIPNTGVRQTKEFWFLGSDDNAREITSCGVRPPADVSVQYNYPTNEEVQRKGARYFTVTFAAQPSAGLGTRDVICHYRGKDLVGLTGINVYSSCVPTITAVTINGQQTNTIIAGTSGRLGISGDCLNNETATNPLSVSVAGGNIQIPSIDSADAYGIVASYTAGASASGSQNLVVQTDRGTGFSGLFATKLALKSVSFKGGLPINVDTSAWTIQAAHDPAWQVDDQGNMSTADPIAYVRGTTMTATVTLAVSPPPANPVPGVRIEGVISGLGKFVAGGVTIPAGGAPVQAAVTADTALPSQTKLYDKMNITWRVGADGSPCSSQCASIGASANQAYVTWAAPIAPPGGSASDPILLTALYHAVSSGGATDQPTAISNTWARFAGPANINTWDGRPLYYYPPGFGFVSCASNAAVLLSSDHGHGQCNSFATLLMAAFAANGISSLDHEVLAKDAFGNKLKMIVKDWSIANSSSGDSEYPYKLMLFSDDSGGGMYSPGSSSNQYGDLVSLPTLPGQHTTPPNEKVFGSHYIVSLSPGVGPYYDPSYGVTYNDPADFQTKAIWGYALPVRPFPDTIPAMLELKAKLKQTGAAVTITILPF
jgi:hypothetical protein